MRLVLYRNLKWTLLILVAYFVTATGTLAITFEEPSITFICREGQESAIYSNVGADDKTDSTLLYKFPGELEPIYQIDRSRNRLYLKGADNAYYFVDLGSEDKVLNKADFFPKGLDICCVAPDGSYLILTKPVSDDEYFRENPLFSGPETPPNIQPDMLFTYDIANGELARITYYYSQKKVWFSEDGLYIVYARISSRDEAELGNPTYILYNLPTGKEYNLNNYFAEKGVDLDNFELNDNITIRKLVNLTTGELDYQVLFLGAKEKIADTHVLNQFCVALIRPENRGISTIICGDAGFGVPPRIRVTAINEYDFRNNTIYFTGAEVTEGREQTYLYKHYIPDFENTRIDSTEGVRMAIFVYDN